MRRERGISHTTIILRITKTNINHATTRSINRPAVFCPNRSPANPLFFRLSGDSLFNALGILKKFYPGPINSVLSDWS
jgi:hypothetical protein